MYLNDVYVHHATLHTPTGSAAVKLIEYHLGRHAQHPLPA
jgi:hypothetical protein